MRVPHPHPVRIGWRVTRWADRPDVDRGDVYDRRWALMAAAGRDVHGEADLVESFGPGTVLDAGCGTGRVAVELARRGIEVVGVDLDESMLETARAKAPHLAWVRADLVELDLRSPSGTGDRCRFDAAVTAGNVMIFLAAATEATVVARLARHLAPEGRLIAGFRLAAGLPLDRYDLICRAAGLELEHRWSTWDRAPFVAGGDYAVSVHRAGRGRP